jgi:hypothetical protein
MHTDAATHRGQISHFTLKRKHVEHASRRKIFMRLTTQQRRTSNYLIAAALILAQVAGFFAYPRTADAARSADPNAEIVYIDDTGVIRVLDTQGDPLVQWFSPDAGWDQITLLDVNDDGDLEILALDKQGESTVRVAVFDPVVTRGATDPNKQINGIPWDKLWETSFSGNGQYIVGGNFDANIPGDEIAVGFRNGDTSVVQIYNANSLDSNQKPTGRDWKVHIQKEYPGFEYTSGTSGQLDGQGADELVLIDQDSAVTRMDIYRPDADMLLTDNETASNDRFKQAAIGQLNKDGNEELAAILTVDRPTKPSLRTYTLGSNGQLDEDELWAFTPQPDWLFLADIRGNGDQEAFFLRNYPTGSKGARLIMRDGWGSDSKQNEGLIEWALMEDGSNNEFRAGAGGDIDGDNKDEIILLRDDRIRVYFQPENGNESSSNFTDYMLKTDNRRENLLAGDLDRNGFSTGPILLVSGNMINAIVPAGTVSQDFTVSVSNGVTQGGVCIITVMPAGNIWAVVNPNFATTPATFNVHFNATTLNPGVYNTTMTLRANQANVQNDNNVVYLNLTVIPPILEPTPPVLNIFRFPCANNPCTPAEIKERNEPFTSTIRINGSTDLSFRAALLGVPAQEDGSIAAITGGLTGPITGGEIDDNGNIVLYDDFGNSRTLGDDVASTAAVTPTLLIDPSLTWITKATLDSGSVPADLSLVIDPSILTQKFQREYAVLVLVADTRAGTPSGNVTLVPIQLADIGNLLWAGYIKNQ